jgi:hypothetical protein
MGIDEWAHRLTRDLIALTEPKMREHRIVEWLCDMEPDYAVRVIAQIAETSRRKDPNAQAVMHALLNLRKHEETIGYQRLVELYRRADDLALEEVKTLLLDGRAQRTSAKRGQDNYRLEKTLGERKQLATTRDRDMIDRLMHDTHPHVIRILLTNPRLVEADVIKMAAARPLATAVVDEIVQSAKWIARYRVKHALVSNPYTPVNIAARLLGYLLHSDLVAVANNSTISKEVRAHAERLLGRTAAH